MKTIPLSRGMVAVVDAADYAIVSKTKWYAQSCGGGSFYAANKNGKTCILMHRVLMHAKKGETVDHRDWDGLNNRRKNLRKVTTSQNGHHRQSAKGYYLDKRRNRWYAQIKVNRKAIHLGCFSTAAMARAAYLDAKKEYGFD